MDAGHANEPACIYDSPDLPESQGKAKCYHRCDNTSLPNCPRFAQHKHSSFFAGRLGAGGGE